MDKLLKMAMGFSLMVMFAACEYDSYHEPILNSEGQVGYAGDPVGLSYNDVAFELGEMGWEEQAPVNVSIDQDGSFSALLFSGDYKLIIPAGRGPFRSVTNTGTQSDTLLVSLSGNTEMDIEVMPYYMIRNHNFSLSGNQVKASFSLEQILTGDEGAGIEEVSLYLSKTNFVDNRTSIAESHIPGHEIENLAALQLEVSVPEMTPTQDYVFARVGVRIAGVQHRLFSEIEVIDL